MELNINKTLKHGTKHEQTLKHGTKHKQNIKTWN